MVVRPSYLAAPPAYPGSKRRLQAAIFGLVASVLPPSDWHELTLADPFLGGGSVSLTAKHYGFGEVLANDLSERSQLIGRAVLANATVKLRRERVLGLFRGASSGGTAGPTILTRLPPTLAQLFARVWDQLRSDTFRGAERDLVALLSLKMILRAFPMSLPTASDAHRVPAREFDHISSPRLLHYLRAEKRLARPGTWLRAADEINLAVIPGVARVSGLDAFDFLSQTNADVVYVDPPYAGTQSYEKAFGMVDEFLGAPPLPPSCFSSRAAPLDELLDACRRVPVLVLSLNNTLFDEDSLRALVARHRRVERMLSLPYAHYRSVATAAKNSTNREFLVLGVR